MVKHLILPSIVVLLFIGFLLSFFLTKQKIACANSISCTNNLSTLIENDAQGIFLGQIVDVPDINPSSEKMSTVLGETDQASSKHIYVDLAQQKLYAFDGDKLFLETLVSTGKWGRTPPGEYRIWVKIRSTRMSGGSGNDAYDLPNVPFNMFFYSPQVPKSRGYALHGAYWHNNFGHEMSHGCVNMRPIDAEQIYNWTNPISQKSTTYESVDDPGTQISICNQILLNQGTNPVCLE